MVIRKIGVVGAGTMGLGIAQACATAGYEVVLNDIKPEFVDKALVRMAKILDKSVEKGKMDQETRDSILARVSRSTDYTDFANVDVVCEAVLENMELKKSVFGALNEICREDAIFCTNTSSMSITEISVGSGRPGKFCGMHFFNPVHVMKLVEVISGELTDPETAETILGFAKSLGKTPVRVKKDIPGFIVNRLLLPYMNEAAKMLSEGVADIEDIDTAVKLGLNYPMGPFQMLDMGGIDLTCTILEYYREEFGDDMYAPDMVLKQMLRAGKLGQKSGQGFYKY